MSLSFTVNGFRVRVRKVSCDEPYTDEMPNRRIVAGTLKKMPTAIGIRKLKRMVKALLLIWAFEDHEKGRTFAGSLTG
jgi:hypothetical protein